MLSLCASHATNAYNIIFCSAGVLFLAYAHHTLIFMPCRDPKVSFLCIWACIIFVLLQLILYRFFPSTKTCIFLVKFLIRYAFRKDKYSHLCYLCCLLALNHDTNDFYRKHSFKIYENVDYRTRICRLSRWKFLRLLEVLSIQTFCSFVWTSI